MVRRGLTWKGKLSSGPGCAASMVFALGTLCHFSRLLFSHLYWEGVKKTQSSQTMFCGAWIIPNFFQPQQLHFYIQGCIWVEGIVLKCEPPCTFQHQASVTMVRSADWLHRSSNRAEAGTRLEEKQGREKHQTAHTSQWVQTAWKCLQKGVLGKASKQTAK